MIAPAHSLALAILGVLLAAPGGAKGPAEHTEPRAVVKVEMTNTLRFTPDTVRIKVGDVVEWDNTSLLTHTVTADPSKSTIKGSAHLPKGAKPFDSGNIDPKGTFKHRFTVKGSYGYFCQPHEAAQMWGVVIVE